MSNKELRNVFEGPDSMERYFDLEAHPPLPLVEIPSALNPYRAKGVRIYAKMMTMHPAHNVKVVPAMEMLRHGVTRGETRTIVEYSSGSTVLSMAMIGRVYYGIDDVCAYVSNKTSKAKLRLLQLFGLNVTLFGGPSQPGPYDRRGGIHSARECAADTSNAFNPNQYENDRNWKAHARSTGPQILKQLPHINVICAGIGTAGTMTGLGDYFEKQKPSVFRLGVCTKPGQRVPGPRTRSLLTPVQFPWQAAAHEIEQVGAHDAFEGSMELCRWGLVCGPSSGFNLRGLLQFLRKRDEQDDLGSLRGFDVQIRCVFMCCDLPYQYIDEYFHTLGPESFPPIANENLTDVDLYRYDDQWEQDPANIAPRYYKPDAIEAPRETNLPVTFDLRRPLDFDFWHLPGAINYPLATLSANTPSPCFDPAVLEAQWKELDDKVAKACNGDVGSRLRPAFHKTDSEPVVV